MHHTEKLLIEAALGRSLSPAERNSIPDLNRMPDDVVAAARKLESTHMVRQLLEYYCGLQCRPYLPGFIDRVIVRQQPAGSWRRGDALVPAPALAALLCMDRAALMAPLGGHHGLRVRPDIASWQAGSAAAGAPAQQRPDASYRSAVPEGTINLAAPQLEASPDEAVTVRRWIASRIARCVAPEQPSSDKLHVRYPSLPAQEEWSEDARVAFAALLREYRDLPPSEEDVPGFRGPDSWYQASA